MKKLAVILLVLSVIISCQNELKLEKENFNLNQDFTKISKKLTSNDTVGVFVNLSFYHHDFRSDYLKISKSKDSFKIFISRDLGIDIFDENGNKVESRYNTSERLESKIPDELVIFGKSESFLKFDKLIQENKNALKKTKKIELPHLIFQNQSDTLHFHFSSKNDWRNFKYEYCQLMYSISSYNEHYKEWGDTYFKDSIY